MDFISGWCKSKRRLQGILAIVTGGNAGIGRETVLDLYLRGECNKTRPSLQNTYLNSFGPKFRRCQVHDADVIKKWYLVFTEYSLYLT